MKRVLIPIVGQGSITHIIRSGILNGMKEFCKPVISIAWNQPDLEKELLLNNIEVHRMPDFFLSPQYLQLRSKINQWYNKEVLCSPSTSIQMRYLNQYLGLNKKFKRGIKSFIEYLNQHLFAGYVQDLIKKECLLIKNEMVFSEYKEWIESLNISGLYTVTPFVFPVELIGRVCKDNNLPIVASIHSFDNVTKRPWPAIFFDHYIVWNKYNKSELQRIKAVLQENEVTIAGAPQFDFHFNQNFGQIKAEWMKRLNIPDCKKLILYAGGPANLFPNEPQYLKHLNEAFVQEKITSDAIIVFRPHPLDKPGRWKKYVGNSPYIVYDESPNGTHKPDHTNVNESDIDKLISSLRYTDVHINICSTMAVDGCVFNKPQIGPAYDEVNSSKQYLLRKMYQQEHYLPIIKSNVIQIANSKERMIQLVDDALKYPAKYNSNCYKCVEEIITYTDGRSKDRVINALKPFFS